MDIDYVVDKKGNKYKIKTSIDFGAIVTTSILPELRPIDIQCIDRNGYAFSRLREQGYSNMEIVDEQRILAVVEGIDKGMLLPGVDSIYSFIHPSNKSAMSRNKLFLDSDVIDESDVVMDGIMYKKASVSVQTLYQIAHRIKEKCSETSLTKS